MKRDTSPSRPHLAQFIFEMRRTLYQQRSADKISEKGENSMNSAADLLMNFRDNLCRKFGGMLCRSIRKLNNRNIAIVVWEGFDKNSMGEKNFQGFQFQQATSLAFLIIAIPKLSEHHH